MWTIQMRESVEKCGGLDVGRPFLWSYAQSASADCEMPGTYDSALDVWVVGSAEKQVPLALSWTGALTETRTKAQKEPSDLDCIDDLLREPKDGRGAGTASWLSRMETFTRAQK